MHAPAQAPLREVRAYYADILPFYELEAAGRSDLAYWKRLCRLWKPESVLEIGSGLGRVTRAIAPLAERVAGIDISISMLARARSRSAAPAAPWLVAADMRRVPLLGGFDLVIAPSDPFSHLAEDEDRRQALCSVARALRPAGRFVLDGLYLPEARPQTRVRRFPTPRGMLTVRETWEPLEGLDLWRGRYRYRLFADSETREKSAAFVARSWDPCRLVQLFDACGLEVEEIRGGFGAEPVGPASRRVVVVARPRPTGDIAARRAR